MRKEYHKLVRDRIPEIIEAEGHNYAVRRLDDAEYRAALRKKVVEEAQEIASAQLEDLPKEVGDLYEVLSALIAAHGISDNEIRKIQARRRDARGAFQKQLELLWVE